MHHAVPEAAARRFDLLADDMRLVQIVVQQPDAGQTTAGHVEIRQTRTAERGGKRRLLQRLSRCRVRPAGAERAIAIDREERLKDWAVLGRLKRTHRSLP
jgi:hypothetical protein